MDASSMNVVQALVRCALAVTECMGVICRYVATLLEGNARMMRKYSEEPEVVQQELAMQPEHEDLGLAKEEPVDSSGIHMVVTELVVENISD